MRTEMKKALIAWQIAVVLLFFGSAAFARPVVAILATGGTIAGTAASPEDIRDYKAGTLGVEALVSAVPELRKHADIRSEQICNINSSSMTQDVWLKLAGRCVELLASDDVQGIVITHGTDTL